MKNILFICFLLLSVTFYPTKACASEPIKNFKLGIPYQYTPPEGSVEEMYKDIIVTLLYSSIHDEIANHYGESLQYDLFSVEFLSIERPSYRSFTFLTKLQVKPFVGSHNTVGIDEIIIKISPGKTQVEKFEHIKSYPIPPHLKDYYKDLKLVLD